MLKTGDKMPDFEVVDQDGNKVFSSDLSRRTQDDRSGEGERITHFRPPLQSWKSSMNY